MKLQAILIAAVVAMSGMFAVNANAAPKKDRKACADSCSVVDGRGMDKMYRPQKFTDFAFEGILLSVDQQAQIDAINADYAAKCQAMRAERAQKKGDCKKGDCKKGDCKKDDCKKGDCKKDDCKKDSCDMRGPKAMKACKDQMRKDYIEAVKGVLTPEQYTTFLENIVFMPQQPKMAPQHRSMKADGCHGHKAHKGKKPRSNGASRPEGSMVQPR